MVFTDFTESKQMSRSGVERPNEFLRFLDFGGWRSDNRPTRAIGGGESLAKVAKKAFNADVRLSIIAMR